MSAFKTREARGRLRQPAPLEVEKVCGFRPSDELLELYRSAPFIELDEFCLVDTSIVPEREWCISEFTPLTARDVEEQRKITKVQDGIPIARDLAKGVYVYLPSGAIILREHGLTDEDVEVAPDATKLLSFRVDRELA